MVNVNGFSSDKFQKANLLEASVCAHNNCDLVSKTNRFGKD